MAGEMTLDALKELSQVLQRLIHERIFPHGFKYITHSQIADSENGADEMEQHQDWSQ